MEQNKGEEGGGHSPLVYFRALVKVVCLSGNHGGCTERPAERAGRAAATAAGAARAEGSNGSRAPASTTSPQGWRCVDVVTQNLRESLETA